MRERLVVTLLRARALAARVGPKRGAAVGLALVGAAGGAAALRAGDPCEDYAFDARVYAQCIVTNAASADTIEEARCEAAGEFEARCRRMWIQERSDLPLDELLKACFDEECRFYALDLNPLPFVEHLSRCEALPSLWVQCASHATIRYLGGYPSREEQAATFAQVPRWSRVVAGQLGLYIACGGASDCGVVDMAAPECVATTQWGATPDQCASFRPSFPRPPQAQTVDAAR